MSTLSSPLAPEVQVLQVVGVVERALRCRLLLGAVGADANLLALLGHECLKVAGRGLLHALEPLAVRPGLGPELELELALAVDRFLHVLALGRGRRGRLAARHWHSPRRKG